MIEFEFNNDNSQIGFRLQYLELLNWGTFHENIWRIEPNGFNSLLTGSIGSGKSTLVDALTCLIVPHHKITFNKAANAESKERSITSYIKGYYKFQRDEIDLKGKAVSLRYVNPGDATFTVILANFNNTGYDTNVTLAQILWIDNDKPQKLLLISHKPLTIKEYFTGIEDVRELRKKLKEHPFIELFDDNFKEYSQKFRHLFGMNSDRAIELFYQTVSMKSVSSLTEFVRVQMLERTDIKEQINVLKKRFDDLNKAYAAVQQARKQKDILYPVIELNKTYEETISKIATIDNIVQSIPSYFASKKIALLTSEIKNCEGTLNRLGNELKQLESQLKGKRLAESQINQDIDKNGGLRIKEILREIEKREQQKKIKKDTFKEYSDLIVKSDLPNANSDKYFYSNLKLAQQKIIDVEKRQGDLLSEQAIKLADLRIQDGDIEREKAELASLNLRKTQIPLDIITIREQISTDLEINQMEIPFIGELIRVRATEKDWEASIERLLRGFGISMLVPEKNYRYVSQYVNERKLMDSKNRGMRFEYYKVCNAVTRNNYQDDIDPTSVVNKIEIKPDTSFGDWLEIEIQKRFNLKCVPLEEFQRQGNVITKEGQFKTGNQKHTKDDRRDLWDKRNFVLGWTNQEKITAVEKHLDELEKGKETIDTAINKLKGDLEKNRILLKNLNSIVTYTDWNKLNWQDEVSEISKLEQEKTTLETSNDILGELEKQLNIITGEIVDLETKQSTINKNIGGIETDIKNHNDEIIECTSIKDSLLQSEAEIYYPMIDTLLENDVLTFKNIDAVSKRLITRFTGKNGEKDELTSTSSKTSRRITALMKEFKDTFPSETMELTLEIEAREEYLEILQRIVLEGLPAHALRFKKMLNENTVNDIVAFDSKLDNHFKSIKKKIGDINKHLEEIEFNSGTYIELLDDRNTDEEIKKFRSELKECYGNILDTGDAYTEERFSKVKLILDRFSSNDSKQIEWSEKVTDVRNWFIFNASEKYSETGEEKEFYAGTSGKSGGQKEKLAYTILASALAYQFGLSYGEPKSKSFRFVVIDEAFGRGDDESTQFGLGLFKKLNLQLLIVTPLQKIHVIENYINSVHYVSNIYGNSSEIQNLTVEEYKQQKQSHSILNDVEVIKENS